MQLRTQRFPTQPRIGSFFIGSRHREPAKGCAAGFAGDAALSRAFFFGDFEGAKPNPNQIVSFSPSRTLSQLRDRQKIDIYIPATFFLYA